MAVHIAAGSGTSISATITSDQTRQRFFELRDITSGQACGHLFRHLALLAFCHLFSRQTTRKSDILYTYATYSVVSSAVHFRFELKKPDDKRHDLYLTASLRVSHDPGESHFDYL